MERTGSIVILFFDEIIAVCWMPAVEPWLDHLCSLLFTRAAYTAK